MNPARKFILMLMLIACGCGGTGRGSAPQNLGTNAELADLVLAGVALDQIFQSAQTDYTATVSPLMSTTTVTPTPADPNATITVNGVNVVATVESVKITLNHGSNTITVVVIAEDGATNITYTIDVTRESVTSFAEQAFFKATNIDPDDRFGNAVAVDGDTLAVAARFEDSAATGVGGDQANNSASNSGAIYIYTRDGSGMWSQPTYIKSSNSGADDQFGFFFALDLDTIAVEAHAEDSSATGVNGDQADNSAVNSGAAYVFD